MFAQMNAIAGYGAARSVVAPMPGAAAAELGRPPQALAGGGDRFQVMLDQVDQTAVAAMTGKADTHVLVQRVAEAELALETVVAVRDKVVEAWQDILRMPV